MRDEVPALAVGTLVAGKLRIVRALGIGGMGTVYEVEHEITRHRRALKLLHAEFAGNSHAVARFLREASAAGRIGSPHIVETFDAGLLDTGEPYLVMEMLDGRSLADILEDSGQLSERDAIEWVAQACDGVQAAHNAGIIHRDLKPDNLFVQRSGQVKILDFGISKFDPSITGEQQLTGDLTLGTPYYMAPEQTTKTASVDVRTDVYALGVVLYECVTGRKPFDAETFPQLIVRIHLGDYAPASSVCGTSALVDGIIAKAMARKPEDRFQTAAQLAAALRDAIQATERAGSPFDSTQRASDLASLLERQKQPKTAPLGPTVVSPGQAAAPPATPTTPPESPGRVAAAVSGNEPTLLSAGSDSPPPAASPRSWILLVAALLGVGVAGAYWSQARAKAAASPPGITPSRSEPAIAAPVNTALATSSAEPQVTALPSADAAPHSVPASPPVNPPTLKSSKPASRAKEHALAEENPFR